MISVSLTSFSETSFITTKASEEYVTPFFCVSLLSSPFLFRCLLFCMLVRTDFDSSLVFFIIEASARGEWYSCSQKAREESDEIPSLNEHTANEHAV